MWFCVNIGCNRDTSEEQQDKVLQSFSGAQQTEETKRELRCGAGFIVHVATVERDEDSVVSFCVF